jgi:urea transport system permease protein
VTTSTDVSRRSQAPADRQQSEHSARHRKRRHRVRLPARRGGAVRRRAARPLDFRLDLLSKYLCYGIVAIGIGLAWGRGGLLVLGQGVFFGLGGYAMAMHLKLADAGPGNLPDFVQLHGGVTELPRGGPFSSPVFAILAAVLLPMVVAALLGLLIFRRRVRGAYFAILSRALAAAMVIWIVGHQGTTGGTNGLTDFDRSSATTSTTR